jgi:hypothetical protein
VTRDPGKQARENTVDAMFEEKIRTIPNWPKTVSDTFENTP